MLVWAQGVATHAGLDVEIQEPDVSPLQLQGPKSGEIMAALVGESIRELKYYWLDHFNIDVILLVISRTGWSSELGCELCLLDGSRGGALWEKLMAVGEPMGLKPGHTSSIRHIERGMLSYRADMDVQTNPFELGLDRLVDLEMPVNCIGKVALQRLQQQGVARQQVGFQIDSEPLSGPNTLFWPVEVSGEVIGKGTPAAYSPGLQRNIALVTVASAQGAVGTTCSIQLPDETRGGTTVPKPFYDPRKQITAGSMTTRA